MSTPSWRARSGERWASRTSSDDEVAFTDRDVEALQTVRVARRQRRARRGSAAVGDPGDGAVAVAAGRVAGRDHHRGPRPHRGAWRGDSADAGRRCGRPRARARDGAPDRRTCGAGILPRRPAGCSAASVRDVVAHSMAVGFADLVGFTSLTRHVSEDELAALVDRFEGIAADTIAELGGRVVKTVGDEVMFTADDPAVGAEIAVTLAERIGRDQALPELRVGVACGTVLSRLGDVYGEPVNIASRLTSAARPGSVLVDRELAGAARRRRPLAAAPGTTATGARLRVAACVPVASRRRSRRRGASTSLDVMSDLPAAISLREVGPRDGLQNEAPVPTEAKVELDRRAVAHRRAAHRSGQLRAPQGDPADGRRRRGVEAASPATTTSRYSALVPNLRGAQRALDAGCHARSRSWSARVTRTTARTSTAPPRSRSTTSPR